MEDTEKSRPNSSGDEVEAYFKDLDNRLQSKVCLFQSKISDINEINGDIFNLNSLDTTDYLLDKNDLNNKRHRIKKKRKKSKKRKTSRREPRRSNRRSASTLSSNSLLKEKIENCYNSAKKNSENRIEKNTNKLGINDTQETYVDRASKRTSLENRLELFTFPHTDKNPKDSDELKNVRTKSLINEICNKTNLQNIQNSFEKYKYIKQYDSRPIQRFSEMNSMKEINHEAIQLVNLDKEHFSEKKSLLDLDKFKNRESNLIKNQIDQAVSSLNKCLDQKINNKTLSDVHSEDQHVLGELINKNLVEVNSKQIDDKNDTIKTNFTISNDDDLEMLRNKFREQLVERLFDKNDRKLLEKIRKEKALSSEDRTYTSCESDTSPVDSKRSDKKRKRKRNEKSYKKTERKHKQNGNNREKKKSLTDDEDDNDEISDDNLLENFDQIDSSLVRRSDRIKVIKTKKEVTKEQKIAEKMKKLSSSSDLNKLQDDSGSKDASINLVDFDQENYKLNQENFESKAPISVNDSNAEQISETFEWPSNFAKIDENIYMNKKYNNKDKESKNMICDCSHSEQERQMGIGACGVDCLNRMLLIECGNRCPCGEYCTNKNFKTKNNAKILPFKTENKGWGLKTVNDLKSESFLIEYVGEVIDLKEFKKRCETYSEQNNEHFYFMALQNDVFIDATKKGNISRFFNHSCDPNCETQKWTVNGELRIGFFTRRPVKANEELTFDYQFQTVGKKQQKCYCGSEKCRGYLGASSNSQLNTIWESDSEINSSSSELSISEDQNESEPEDKENKKIKRKAIKNLKPNKDRELNRQIKSIRSLSNKENVLKLCQLMFRTESLDLRLEILNLLLNTKAEISLRLFMDYHGLKLLWGWMIDSDNKLDTIEHLEFKIKILEVLSMLPIKNRTIIEECKLLVIVKKWSDFGFRPNFDIQLSDSNNQELDPKTWIVKLLNNVVDVVFEDSERKNDQDYQNFCLCFSKIKSKAQSLYTEWSNLKVAFKIPKKQQIEERKEHEREVNELFKEDHEKPTNFQPSQNNSSFHSRFSNKWNNRYKGFNKFYRSKPYYKSRYFWSANNHNMSEMSKEQRRKLFEEKVRLEEEKAAAEAAAKMQEQEKISDQNAPSFKWIFDSRINQWVQYQVPNFPSNMPTLPNSIFSPVISSIQNTFLPVPPPPPPPPQPTAETSPFKKIDLTDSNFKNLQQAILQIAHSTQEINKKIQQNSIKLANSTASKPKCLSSIAAKLPPGWKCKRNKKGMIYYYNIKTKKTQWNFPKLAKTVTSKQKSNQNENKPNQEKILNENKDDKLGDVKLSPAITSTTSEKYENDFNKSVNSEASTSGLVTASNNSFKAYRDQFREKLSKLIIKILQPFLNKDCKYGHIRNNEDFKHLARKFTHTIMEKEISRATNLEELDLDKRIKLKAKDYICKYMQKFRDGYSKNADDS
uniref:[histone H3]-lysine(36) N-trimethyltransferase n=1 Tax=Brachionus koreanus TaxID=1199090 RepID=A0A4Y6EZ29_9BILA|nr:histone-lysine N-methyltransferase SETD2-like protein isoform X1 [Brachionus koreanus]